MKNIRLSGIRSQMSLTRFLSTSLLLLFAHLIWQTRHQSLIAIVGGAATLQRPPDPIDDGTGRESRSQSGNASAMAGLIRRHNRVRNGCAEHLWIVGADGPKIEALDEA